MDRASGCSTPFSLDVSSGRRGSLVSESNSSNPPAPGTSKAYSRATSSSDDEFDKSADTRHLSNHLSAGTPGRPNYGRNAEPKWTVSPTLRTTPPEGPCLGESAEHSDTGSCGLSPHANAPSEDESDESIGPYLMRNLFSLGSPDQPRLEMTFSDLSKRFPTTPCDVQTSGTSRFNHGALRPDLMMVPMSSGCDHGGSRTTATELDHGHDPAASGPAVATLGDRGYSTMDKEDNGSTSKYKRKLSDLDPATILPSRPPPSRKDSRRSKPRWPRGHSQTADTGLTGSRAGRLNSTPSRDSPCQNRLSLGERAGGHDTPGLEVCSSGFTSPCKNVNAYDICRYSIVTFVQLWFVAVSVIIS